MKASIQGKDNAIKKLRMQISQLKETRNEADCTLDFRALDFQITQLTKTVTVLQEQNEIFKAENEKVKQHYKELYNSIKITRAKHIEQTTALLTENENLKAKIHENLKCITMDSIKLIVLTPGRYAIDVEPIPPHNRNNREVHLDYLKHLKESVETLREITYPQPPSEPSAITKPLCINTHPNPRPDASQYTTKSSGLSMRARTDSKRLSYLIKALNEPTNRAVLQIQDHALWDIIENGNSFNPVARTTTNADGTSTLTIPGPVTTEEKVQKKNDVKAISMLLMALPNEYQLTFNQYKDAKTLFEAIKTRFGGNDATKKTQKTLLKQMYESFNAPSTESLDSIFNRLQKIVSQLSILGENISQEDLNLKFLRILPFEWNTHVVVWRNKPDLDSMSFDDLYNNFKIVEQEVKRTVTSSSNLGSNNMAFVTTPINTNEVNTANVQVSTANSTVSTDKQIHEDDLEEIDLKWQLALLSMRARKYYQRTRKKITINGSDTAGYDKSKVECFNCHKMGHFARECRGPRNQESRARNQDSSRRTMNVEDISSKAMVAIDGAGFDWSYMADEEVPTNLALMAFSDSEVHNTCSNTCLKSFETLKTQLDNLRVEFNKSEFNLATYKRGLASVEEQLVFYKKNEVMLCDQIAVLKRDASFKDSEINALNIQIEKLKKEKESNQIKIDNFENASKSLDKLIGSQISDNNRKGVGYNAVPPPPIGLFAPPTIDLSNSGLKEFQQPEFEGYGLKENKGVCENSSNEIKKTTDAPIIEDWVSDCDEDESEVRILKSDNVQQKPKQANQPRKVSENPRYNRTNWNEKKTQKLGVGFQFTKKACFVCGSLNHLIKDCDFHDKKMVQKPVLNNVKKGTGQREVRPVWNNAMRVNHQNFSNSRRNFVPTAVLTKSGIVPVSAARPINTVAPKSFVNAAKTRPNAF
ncbi:ribonuclease H-like domain-containing protein [Tanacetum coccineum]